MEHEIYLILGIKNYKIKSAKKINLFLNIFAKKFNFFPDRARRNLLGLDIQSLRHKENLKKLKQK